MPSKKQTQTIALVAGAGVLAYIIMSKKQAPPPPLYPGVAPSPASSMLSVLTNAAGAVKNLISPSGPSPASYLPTASNPSTLSPVDVVSPSPAPSPAADITAPLVPIDNVDLLTAVQPGETVSGFETVPGTALAVLCGCAACMPPKKAVGAFDYTSLILPGALIIGGYFILKKVGIFNNDTSQNNASIANQTAQGIASSIAKEKANGGFQTVTDAQLSSLAADIWTKGITNPVDQDGIVWDTIQVNTLLDLLLLKQSFQTKNVNTGNWLSWCAIARVNCTAVDFDTFIKGVLDASHLAQINQFMSAQQINYSF